LFLTKRKQLVIKLLVIKLLSY